MIQIENTKVTGWESAIRGMRNPMNSWDKSDSKYVYDQLENNSTEPIVSIGPNDYNLMMNLAKAGSVDAKYRRMITVYADITAPLYWWKEYDTYKVGTVANSCSTMHKIHEKEFKFSDFSTEHLNDIWNYSQRTLDEVPTINLHSGPESIGSFTLSPMNIMALIIVMLNKCRDLYLQTKDKKYWWQMIQLLPSSYNQRRTVMLNYEVLANIYKSRRNHKLDEWRKMCEWIEALPYPEIITCNAKETEK